jgi:hypothetical protein
MPDRKPITQDILFILRSAKSEPRQLPNKHRNADTEEEKPGVDFFGK